MAPARGLSGRGLFRRLAITAPHLRLCAVRRDHERLPLLKGQTELGPDVKATPIPHMFNLDSLVWRRGPKHSSAILSLGWLDDLGRDAKNFVGSLRR